MEFAAYLSAALVSLWVLYWSGRNSVRKPGTPITGIFAYTEDDTARVGKTTAQKMEPSGQWRGAR